MHRILFGGLTLALLVSCDFIKVSTDDSEALQDDTAEGDADADTDSDTDTDADSDIECDGAYDTSPPGGPDCLTGTLSCGDFVVATTEGGRDQLDEDLYQSAFCFVPFDFYDGPERVFSLDVPADTVAEVTLEAPCEDLSLAVLHWSNPSVCPPPEGHNIIECEGHEATNRYTAHMEVFDAARYLVSVDGFQGVAAPFSLEVVCTSRN